MSSDLRPTNLRCEYAVNPLGIDETAPRLSWELESEQRGARQSAYQIRVASSAEQLQAGTADRWDSGRVESAASTQIAYAGAALESGARCWWQVQVWDAAGASSTSAPAHWEIGLLHADDWQAQWIALHEPASDVLQPSPFFRKPLQIDRPVATARIYATSRGVYELHIDGQRIGDALLAPGWTEYKTRIQYQTYDVTALLQPGAHALGAILGSGWYSGYIGFGNKGHHYGVQPQLLLQLQIDYEDGSRELIMSDSSWKGAFGPILISDMLMGETYDARAELTGWDSAGYDDAEWQPVSAHARDSVALVAERGVPVRVTEELRPKRITQFAPDVQIVDFGQNMVGWVQLSVQGEAGSQVRLRFAEILDADGSIYTLGLRTALQTDTYILKGGEHELFEPRFTFHGFRYVEVTGYPGTLTPDALTGRVLHSDTPVTGSFSTDNALVNQLQRNITWGQRGNFLSVPTDCPQRDERLGWMGDAQIFVRTAAYNMDVAAFFTKWMRDVVDAQSDEGGFPDVAPRLVDLSDAAPAWGDAGVIVPWTIYQQYGDTRMIERNWDAMAAWIDYIHAANPTLLWIERRNNDFGDWLSIKANTPREVLATAYWAYDTSLMAKMARVLGKHDEAARYDTLFNDIKAAFNRAFVSEDGRIAGNTQTCYVLALHMNLLPDALRAQAAARLVADIESKGGHLSTGFVGVGYLLPVLTNAGYDDVAYRLLLNETFPSWGYSIRHGATTIWERWDGWTEENGFQDPGMNSFNHYSLGSVGQWLYQYAAGIDVNPQQPGFADIVIRPHTDQRIKQARASYHSIHGVIGSEWASSDSGFTLNVTIPANTSATVYLPSADAASVTEAGQPLAEVAGVQLLRVEAGHAVLAVGAGSYAFASTR